MEMRSDNIVEVDNADSHASRSLCAETVGILAASFDRTISPFPPTTFLGFRVGLVAQGLWFRGLCRGWVRV